ncbi:hypothetical protein NE645_18605, partial [Roseburia hominis]|nr:hypothetical protein [Roseburia hominis]
SSKLICVTETPNKAGSINLLLNTIWASFMQDGSVSWLYSAERMTELPLGLIGVAIGTVILPSLSMRHAEQDQS